VRSSVALALGLALAALAAPAGAALDPSRAAEHADALRDEAALAFCRAPKMPLEGRSLALCAHARAIAGCEVWAKACDEAHAAPPQRERSSMAEWLRSLEGAFRVLLWVLVAGAIGVVLWLLVRALRSARADARVAGAAAMSATAVRPDEAKERVAPLADADLLLRHADALARAGRGGEAMSAYLHASLRALGARGVLPFSRDRTNGEAIRACRDEAARAELRAIAYEVDRVEWGREPATDPMVSEVASRARRIVKASLVATFVLALFGCGGGRSSDVVARTPGGTELVQALLRRQGVDAAPLSAPLARVPLPADDDDPILVVDFDVTEVDEDTRAHLLDWVDAGGTLVAAGDAPLGLDARRTMPLGAQLTVDDLEERAWSAPLAMPAALRSSCAPWARVGTDPYAVLCPRGEGRVLAVASGEIFTNAFVARREGAAAAVALLGRALPTKVRFAGAVHGVAPPANPLSGMIRAGFGLALLHAALFAVVLFLAEGRRLARPVPTAPPARRAFAEHVRAVGALYARGRAAPHALAVFVRFIEERLRASGARGGDPATLLAHRSGEDRARVAALWMRASREGSTAKDALATLAELSAVWGRARREGSSRARG
jgi:hypothetical protein